MNIHHNVALALRDEPMEAMTRIGHARSPDAGTAFRDAMRRVVTAVHVVTSDGPHGRAGMTASAVTSVSDRPPTVLVCLNGSSASAARLIKNGVFCINTLGPGDEEIAATFAGRTELPQQRRFERGPLEHARHRRPDAGDRHRGVRLPPDRCPPASPPTTC